MGGRVVEARGVCGQHSPAATWHILCATLSVSWTIFVLKILGRSNSKQNMNQNRIADPVNITIYHRSLHT